MKRLPSVAVPVAAAAAAVLLVAGCASSTSGTPTGAPGATGFPSTSAAPSTSASAAPSATAGSTTHHPQPSTHPVPAQPLATKTVTASDGTVYAVSIWAERQPTDCAAHAYGQVASFLAAHQCAGLRQLLATTAIGGRAVGFAQNSLGFAGTGDASYRNAGNFLDLVTADGTGNVNDLLREGYRLPAGPDHVPSPDAFKALGQDNGVVVTDAWYLEGSTPANDPALVKMAEDLFLQF